MPLVLLPVPDDFLNANPPDDAEPAPGPDPVAGSCEELRADLRATLARVAAQRARMAALRCSLDAHAQDIAGPSADAVAPLLDRLTSSYDELAVRLQAATTLDGDSGDVLAALVQHRRDAFWRWRSLQGVAAALMAAVNWQSPSFGHSMWSQAGTQTGAIMGTKNDYLRDHHGFADLYERAFAHAYVDARSDQRVHAYATASGMAAHAMAVAFLGGHGHADGPVLAGASCWFQNRIVLHDSFGGRLHDVDEHDTDGILEAVARHKPCAIFLDSIGNTESFPMPDLARLIPALAQTVARVTTLVIDNTCMGAMCQPIRHLPLAPTPLRLIVTEGLNKFHQFGADRVTAGILWTVGDDFPGLFETRMVLGCNIPDTHVHALSPPDRAQHDARMLRIGRNALHLAQRLQATIAAAPSGVYESIVHPGLPSHPAHRWASRRSFHGGSLNLVSRPAYRSTAASMRFIALALDEARQAGVDLIAGSGFGFDTTRIYLTALFAGRHTAPFLRISAGTESRAELERLATVLSRAVRRMDTFPPSDFADDASSNWRSQWLSLRRFPLAKWRTAGAMRR